jgi:hypothetical protein
LEVSDKFPDRNLGEIYKKKTGFKIRENKKHE